MKGGENVSAELRRRDLISDIIIAGKTTVSKLASEHGVSTRTIMRDLDYLSILYPIRFVRGRCGGIELLESDYLKSAEHKVKERTVLKKIIVQHSKMEYCQLEDYEVDILREMVKRITV